MEDAIEQGGDRGHIAQQFAPALDGAVGSEQRTGGLVAALMISSRSSAAVSGSLRMPKSSMRSSGTVVSESMNSLRVPSATASARSSNRTCVSR